MRTGISIFVFLVISIVFHGCSKISNAVLENPSDSSTLSEFSTCNNICGILGYFELNIMDDKSSAELNPLRTSLIGESYLVNGANFFTHTPCSSCLRLRSFVNEPPYIKIIFEIDHPFEPGDSGNPPSAVNRLDLDIFDLAMVIIPREASPSSYSSGSIYTNITGYQDGFTTELYRITGDSSACPYFLVIDDSSGGTSTFNRFAMGTRNKQFDAWFSNPGRFEVYLTMGYGFSAKKADRLHPKYYNPEFNRKSAWKVDVIPPQGANPPAQGNTWDDQDTTTEYDVTVEVYDWQINANVNSALTNQSDIYASSEVSKVSVEIPGMTSVPAEVSAAAGGTGMPGNPLIYNVPLANQYALPPGDYTGLVKVLDERIPPDPFSDRDFIIDAGPTFSTDVSPPSLNFSPMKVAVSGNYLYVASNYVGLHIFNIADASHPRWVKWFDLPFTYDVKVDGNYAYVADGNNGVYIIDVSAPETAHIINNVRSEAYAAHSISISGGYALVAKNVNPRFCVLDIDPPQTAHLEMEIPSGIFPEDLCVRGNYAYVMSNNNLIILDINPPESTCIINTIAGLDLSCRGIDATDEYAYISQKDCLAIYDINPPESAFLFKTVPLEWPGISVKVDNGYAYVSGILDGVYIVDVDPPQTASLVKTIPTYGAVRGIDFKDGYIYAADSEKGIYVIDANPIDTAFTVGTAQTPGQCRHLNVDKNHVYALTGKTFQVIDIDPIHQSHIINTFDNANSYCSSSVSNGYAYVANTEGELLIIDIDPPETAYVANSITMPDSPNSIFVENGYAVAFGFYEGLMIFDVEPPESAHLVKTLPLTGVVSEIVCREGYAYLAHTSNGLTIVDIDPPESAYIVTNLPTDAQIAALDIVGDYAYLLSFDYNSLKVVDITPPESAYVVSTVTLPDFCYGIEVADNYAYIGSVQKLLTFDISKLSSIHQVDSIEFPATVFDVQVHGAYCILASDNGGVLIVRRYNPVGGLLNYSIPEYATYQTFTATVVSGN